MFKYRISKYNPTYRNEEGIYTKEEWTAYADIGKSFGGKIFTEKEYLKMEQRYIDFILSVLKEQNISRIMLENQEPEVLFKKKIFNIQDKWLIIIMQQILRENFWAKLKSKEIIIYFGYDYYIHIESKIDLKEILQKLANTSNLFVEII